MLSFWGPELGFGVPYFKTFFLKGTNMKQKFILFSPWLLKSPVKKVGWGGSPGRVCLADRVPLKGSIKGYYKGSIRVL